MIERLIVQPFDSFEGDTRQRPFGFLDMINEVEKGEVAQGTRTNS
jgi:hypothetical protein